MSKRNRVLTVLLAAAVLFVMLSSAFFIAIEADHNCTGEDCPVCCQIEVCIHTLKSVGHTVVLLILAAFIGITMFSIEIQQRKGN